MLLFTLSIALLAAAPSHTAPPKAPPLTDAELAAYFKYEDTERAPPPAPDFSKMTPKQIQAHLASMRDPETPFDQMEKRDREAAKAAGLDLHRAHWIGRAVEVFQNRYLGEDPRLSRMVTFLKERRAKATGAERARLDRQLKEAEHPKATSDARLRREFGEATARVLRAHSAELHERFETQLAEVERARQVDMKIFKSMSTSGRPPVPKAAAPQPASK